MTVNLKLNSLKSKFDFFYFAFALLILFRIFLILNVGLIDDETYHWTWAKNLNYSYFDHPGMVAWMIWPFIKIFGDQIWAIRLPGFLMYLSICYLIYQLGKQLFNSTVGKLSALFLFFIPLWSFASLGTLPDIPLAFFWLLIALTFWQSVKESNPWSPKKTWILIGLYMGLGMNSKLTCCLIGLGMGLFLLLSPKHRKHLLTPWPYIGSLITFILMTPIIMWNSKNNWASFQYQFFKRHQEAHGADFHRWLEFWSYQWVFMSPVIYILIMIVLLYSLRKIKSIEWKFIFCLPIPALVLFYYQPLMSAYKPHWSGPAYMILLIGAVRLILNWWNHLKTKGKIILSSVLILSLLPFQLLYIPLFTPVIPKIYAATQTGTKWNPTWDFSNEFYGWLELGQYVKDLQLDMQNKNGRKPLLAAQRYELMSQLTWATNGQMNPVWQLSDDIDQFYFDQDVKRNTSLIGNDFLIVNNDKYSRDPLEITKFDSCEKFEFPFYREKILARTFFVYYCKNFQGLK